MTDRNAWMKQNLALLRLQSDLSDIVLSPGAAGGLAVIPSISGGAGSITIDLVAPSPLPAGWTIVAGVGVAILDQDPTAPTAVQIYAGQDLTSTYSVVLSALAAGDYQASGWFVYQRSASATDLAYGPGTGEPVTVT